MRLGHGLASTQVLEAGEGGAVDVSEFTYDYRRFDMAIPASLTSGQTAGIRSAGFVDRAWGGQRDVSLAAGNNKIFEICESVIVQPANGVNYQQGPLFSQPFS